MPSTTQPPYRIGIIGIGAIASMHARAIADLDHARLLAGSSRTEHKGRAFAEQFGCRWYPDYEQLLDQETPDLVTICTPSGAHLEPALAAIERGVHVLVEKPLEITLHRIDTMIDAARQRGVTLGGIFPQRYNPVLQATHDAAAAGRFGSLAAAGAYVPWWRDDHYYAPHRWQGTLALDGGGALMNQSIHAVDALQWIASAASDDAPTDQNPVEQVFAYTAKRAHDPQLLEVEDTCVASLRLRGGALGQILAATSMWPGQQRRLQFAGRDGFTEILEQQLLTWQFRDAAEEDDKIRSKFSAASATEGGASDPLAIDYTQHTRNIAAFLDALQQGGPPLMLSGHEARKAVAIIEAIYESARTGEAVDVT